MEIDRRVDRVAFGILPRGSETDAEREGLHVQVSVGAVSKYLRAVRTAAGIGPTEAETLPESELEQRVFGPAPPAKPPRLVPPDYAWLHTELKRHRHVTLQLLWEEYVERHGDAAYRRSAFCEGYRRWERRLMVAYTESPFSISRPNRIWFSESKLRISLPPPSSRFPTHTTPNASAPSLISLICSRRSGPPLEVEPQCPSIMRRQGRPSIVSR
jgi:hypothetical protein